MAKRKGMLGGLLLIIGAILLIVALLTSWYTFTTSFSTSQSVGGSTISGSGNSHVDLHPGSSYAYSSSQSYTCTGAASAFCPQSASSSGTCPYSGSSSTGCSNTNEKQTGQLYSVTEFLVIGGLVLGFLAGIFALMSSGKPGMRKGAMALGIIALLLALVAPITLLAAQPAAIKSDFTPSGGSAPNSSGPWSSFFGSCSTGSNCGFGSGSGGNGTFTWGPSVGWYLSIGAFVVFLLGILMVRGGRDSSPTDASMSQSSASMGSDSSMGSGQPAPPPSAPP
ncbi:MAG: hypothetical protein L3K07_04065 [Thermoplasmata archaeon]|nr:hypothetical protein [Thermoplasmata archaeon]